MRVMQAYNKLTGLWFVRGYGFVAGAKHHATYLDLPQLAVVRATYQNVKAVEADRRWNGHTYEIKPDPASSCSETERH